MILLYIVIAMNIVVLILGSMALRLERHPMWLLFLTLLLIVNCVVLLSTFERVVLAG